MNGTEAALVEYARRSHESAEKAATHALKVEQIAGRLERELVEVRRDIRQLSEVVSASLQQPRQHTVLSSEDWEDSPTGTHKMVSKRTFERWSRERELSEDAKKWRKVLNTSGKIALAIVLVVVGWLVRHLMGRP